MNQLEHDIKRTRLQSFARSVVRLFTTGNSFIITLLAFLSALIIGGVIIVMSTPAASASWGRFFSAPGAALAESWHAVAAAYVALFVGSIGNFSDIFTAIGSGQADALVRAFRPISETLVYATPLLMAGLGIAAAFRAGLFDIGGQGQLILGAAGATLAGFMFAGLPPILHVLTAIIFGAAFGAAWGFVPGILKAKTGAHEVITSMMMNYIGLNFLAYILKNPPYQAPPYNQAISKYIEDSAALPPIFGPSLRANLGFVLAVLFALGVAWLLSRSTVGFRFRMLGANKDAARVAGVNIATNYVIAMTLAGMLVGLAGAFNVLGVDHRMAPGYGGSTGFDAITVAILGRGTPVGVVLSSLLFGAFGAGGRSMQLAANIPLQLVQVIQAVLVLFVAAPGVIRTIYRIRIARSGERIFGGWGG
ncbi:MAG TPA: ABC transporter permease [Spirochaetia bacterium]|nr:ABC transporter permease [Spirochaetia bacterium]